MDQVEVDMSVCTMSNQLSFFPADTFSDLDSSFTSSTTSASTNLSGRSSLSLSLPSFKTPAAPLRPLPHHQSDPHWVALRAAANLSPDGLLHLRHLRIVRPLGAGHLARVFQCRLAELEDDSADFALKVIDLDALMSRSMKHNHDNINANWHVRAEGDALSVLDHPFLPTLYARLDASHYACFLIDYCSGGDLHSILRRRRGNRLPPSAARFYAAEVLLALEYLHSQGIVYRDLKPENVLLRDDGHIMLSDFDLSFQSDVRPTVHRVKKTHDNRSKHRQQRWRKLLCLGGVRTEDVHDNEELELVAEPTTAWSKACVGTHEYLAPEVVGGAGHGAAVDWWALGVFLYELLYGRTPFKGGSKEATLRNILSKELNFPDIDDAGSSSAEFAKANDLISMLVTRKPEDRMGTVKGAVEIKKHPFFEGVKWQLIRWSRPPVVPGGASVLAPSVAAAARVVRAARNERKVRWWSGWISKNNKGKRQC